ncbi:UNVERIFIED_CONTAM: hypothetical protein GTU68_006991 [Idotea baltica]|nr:hypothetical protein [Idotea baltica]
MPDKDILETGETILLFDGFCNLCAQSVLFVIRNERDPSVKFASLQSPFGQKILARLPDKPDSIVLLEDGDIYTKSDAALSLSRYLKFPLSLFRHFRIIPLSARDLIYDFVARYRYKFFGKKDECMIPSAELRNRFL